MPRPLTLYQETSMRKLKQVGMAVVLTLALATCGSAGIIGTMPEAPPPQSSSLAVSVVLTVIQIALP